MGLYSVSAIRRIFANETSPCCLPYYRGNSQIISPTPRITRINEQNVPAFKTIRLQALRDSPTAFGSTYACESQFDEAEWQKRAANLSGDRGIGFIAVDNDSPFGIIGAFPDECDARTAQIVSMWVAPTHRRSGWGSVLIDAVRSWAQAREIRTLRLTVTSCNYGAMEFYRQNGFAMTGKIFPYPNDPSIIEYEMAQSVPPTSFADSP
ncbi:MAG: GNAT family N-acetyltransferase [Silvibacterium sp.]|nr:GNAT family N-acetyltransferase [Silvibacterium sp.]